LHLRILNWGDKGCLYFFLEIIDLDASQKVIYFLTQLLDIDELLESYSNPISAEVDYSLQVRGFHTCRIGEQNEKVCISL
jgi:hypothetical protein